LSTVKRIAPGIYVETAYRRVTVGAILTGEGVVCIDTPPYPADARDWRAQLSDLSPKPVLFVINTDAHRDRILGNSWFDAPVVAHQAAAERMFSFGSAFVSQAAEEMSADDGELIEIASLKPIPPQISYTERMQLIRGERKITLVHKPSASTASTWVVFPAERVVFVGDTIVVSEHPYMDHCVSKAWLDVLVDLRRERFAGWRIVPGRGPVTDQAATGPVSEYVRLARRRVWSLYRASQPRTEVAGLVPEFLPMFPVRQERRDETEHRIRAGLERIYDEYQAGEQKGEV
jgi:glyoxylase-like metal-dependent hydrolase (beta-lactamase superfamily II)